MRQLDHEQIEWSGKERTQVLWTSQVPRIADSLTLALETQTECVEPDT